MSKKQNKNPPKRKKQGFQRVEESYRVPTHLTSDYLGETQGQKDKPTKEDLKKLIERCRANMDIEGNKGKIKLSEIVV